MDALRDCGPCELGRGPGTEAAIWENRPGWLQQAREEAESG